MSPTTVHVMWVQPTVKALRAGKDTRIRRLALDTVHLDLMPQVDHSKLLADIATALSNLPPA